ncbi:MAG: potassium-transporting ATPase subunit KdpA, partial [Chitinophagaceae bacterium]|nr:potassium-transporting ATPase subunit KdpA [Oligoflexus sp.]
MNSLGWMQLAAFFGILIIVTKPLGIFIFQVLDPNGKTFLDPILRPTERFCYKILKIDPKKDQNWKSYGLSILIFSLVSMLFTYVILRIQAYLPLNPQNLPNLSEHLAFNTASSFTSNTNWQSYAGESTMSYFSQMVALTFHNFASAAVGIGVAAVLVRGIAGDRLKGIGNFWADLVRILLYLLLPLSIVFAIVLVSQGIVQNFMPYTVATWLDTAPEGLAQQLIAQGPAASQVAIKMLGTNGGGFFN